VQGTKVGPGDAGSSRAHPREACYQVEWLRGSMAAAQIPSRFPRSSGEPGRLVRVVPEAVRAGRTAARWFLRTATRRNAPGRCRFRRPGRARMKAESEHVLPGMMVVLRLHTRVRERSGGCPSRRGNTVPGASKRWYC